MLPCLRPIQRSEGARKQRRRAMAVLDATLLALPDVVDHTRRCSPAPARSPRRARWWRAPSAPPAGAARCALAAGRVKRRRTRRARARRATCCASRSTRRPACRRRPASRLQGARTLAGGAAGAREQRREAVGVAPVEEGIALATRLVRAREQGAAGGAEGAAEDRAAAAARELRRREVSAATAARERLTHKGVKALMAGKSFKWQFEKIMVLKNAKQSCAPPRRPRWRRRSGSSRTRCASTGLRPRWTTTRRTRGCQSRKTSWRRRRGGR